MPRRNAEQLDLLGYRPSVPVLPTPTVTQEGEGPLSELFVTWKAPEGTEIVATDKAEFDRMVESIFATMEAAGIVSFLRWKQQRAGLERAFQRILWEGGAIGVKPFPVAELSVSASTHSNEWEAPREREWGYNGISVGAWSADERETYSGFVRIRAGLDRKSKGWKWLY